MTRYVLRPLDARETAIWDELISPCQNRDLFHSSAWLAFLESSHNVELRRWAIRDGSLDVGYFCGGTVRKGPFRVLGSPLRGWGTNSMGPVTTHEIDHGAWLLALDDVARQERFAMVELESRHLDEKVMPPAGYDLVAGWTYIVALKPQDHEAMWNSLDSKRRNRIRKAMKEGLFVEEASDDAIADEFFDQFVEVMRRKRTAPTYRRSRPRLLVHHLRMGSALMALRVRDSNGRVLATGLFPHDSRTVYFWGGASSLEGRELCPNDLLHWRLMCLAAERGLLSYDMCGNGRFKREFGGQLVGIQRWHKCYWRSARLARRGYEAYVRKGLTVAGMLRSFFAGPWRSSKEHLKNHEEA